MAILTPQLTTCWREDCQLLRTFLSLERCRSTQLLSTFELSSKVCAPPTPPPSAPRHDGPRAVGQFFGRPRKKEFKNAQLYLFVVNRQLRSDFCGETNRTIRNLFQTLSVIMIKTACVCCTKSMTVMTPMVLVIMFEAIPVPSTSTRVPEMFNEERRIAC